MRVNKGMLSTKDPRNLDCTAPRPVEDTSTSGCCFPNTAQVLPPPSERYSPNAG